jgi:non-specific serine/threonine protein kinase
LIAALSWFWWVRGHYSEAKQWTEQVLARRGRPKSPALAQVLAWAGNLLAGQPRDYARAVSFLEQSLDMSRQLGDKASLAWALVMMARVAELRGNAARAVAWAEEGVAVSRQLADPWYISLTLERLGEAARLAGAYERAADLYQESLLLSTEIGDRRNIAVLLHNLGHVRLQQGDLPGAAHQFYESLILAKDMDDGRRILMCLEGMAGVEVRSGELERGARLFGAADRWRRTLGAGFEAADLVAYLRSVSSVQGAQFNGAWSEGAHLSDAEAVRYALDEMGRWTQSVAQLSSQRAGVTSTSKAASQRKRQLREAFDGLTTRECEVAVEVARGKSNRQIADALMVSERTIDKHVGSILSKLEFRSRAQVAAWAVKKGLPVAHE